ncbi:hypothetical protein FA13DRAFT_1732501 [Coprinellus micaceus]|uniref:GH16 domain-containing protein n=1 Tax=Coprinellus micaceus TaxID=71717 RepID=A0A4Y7TCI6_COPMI|nr:hypothetical protein FA13DRAFT_1732501 [Coprinellus micaceus]
MVKIHSLLTTVVSVFCVEGFRGALADLHSQKPGHGHEHGHGSHAIPGYRLTDSIVGRDFFRAFDWEAIGDPTRGRVLYVNETESRSRNLTYAHGDSFVLRGDSETILTPDGPGRPSARIVSKKSYTTHVVVVDLRHMPQGCGTWPAIWQVGKEDWPNRGEVDILEGVNDQGPNASTLHTSTNCTMPAVRNQTGTSGQLDCDVAVNWNTGCGVKFSKPNSYGPDFNKNGGGWLAVERNNQFIKTWFWPRDSQDVPRDVRRFGPRVNPDNWGIPEAFFPNTECDLESHFKEHHIVINLTFCGDWAGQADVYRSSGCPSTCVDYVNNNPEAFKDAYFNFKSLRVYQ